MYFRIDPPDGFDYVQFVVDIANSRPVDLTGCRLAEIPYPVLHFRDAFIEEIVKYGFTTFLELGPINEDLTTPSTPTNKVASILTKHLSSVGVDNELIIIDPYFFAPSPNTQYLDTVTQVLSPFLGNLTDLRVVTAAHGRAYSSTTRDDIEKRLHNLSASLKIHHTQSNELHDRFWISNKRQKGILTGTSLNGLGKKYAIVDYLDSQDVAEIVNEFSRRSLI